MGLTFFMIALFVLFFDSCRRDAEIIPAVAPDDVTFKIPPGFPAPVYNFENNPVTVDGFKLGRRLFYEGRLASDNSISCGFCHQQVNAFANSGHQFSHGVGGLFGTRNAPPVFNLAWNYTFMWDGGINHIENQPLGPIANPVEMNESLANVIAKLNADLSYKDQFKAAFGDDSVTTQRLCRALAQFMGIMISAESKYDQYMRGDAAFTTQESNGLALFRTKCASCHTEPLFSDRSYHNNGLPVDPTINDRGRMMITNDAADSLKFKTPSLRNCAVTYPYMHDGRFMTLSECLNHYAGGVVISPTLDPLLAAGIPLTTQEKSDLLAFLATLTDQKFLTDTRFREQ
ncbi:MAG TPA: cytochrome c peroxidase [Bacteroidia bacterium]|nr:cytochrome c peroxidase [Bacteroidia bacterium]